MNLHRPFYVVQAYFPGDPGYLGHKRVRSRRQASKWFGIFRTKFPGALVTLNRTVYDYRAMDGYFNYPTWVNTTHHSK